MHIVQLYHAPVPIKKYGGMERVIENLCLALIELGHKVTLLSYTGEYKISGVHHVEIPTLEFDSSPTAQNGEPNFLPYLPDSADVIHVHTPLPLKKPLPIPAILTLHGNLRPDEDLGWWKKRCVFLTQNHAMRHKGKISIFNGLNPNDIPWNPKSLKHRSHFAFLGRASLRRKGLKEAIWLAQKLHTKLLVGGKSGWSFRKGVSFLGQLDNPQKYDLLMNAKALLFPISWEEPFGLVMIEAMFCGTPVFGFNRGSVAEVLGGNLPEAKFFLKSDTQEELLEKMKHYDWDTDPALIRKYAENNFGHILMAERYLKQYQKQISNIK